MCVGNKDIKQQQEWISIEAQLADRKAKTYNLSMQWSWPWDDIDLVHDLDLRQVNPSSSDVHAVR